MQRIWALIVAMIVGCSSGNGLARQEGAGTDSSCMEVAISDLPISEDALRKRISELTGYMSGYELERPCRHGDGYLLRVVPPKERRHGIFTVLLAIDADGEMRVVPSQ